MSEDNFLSPKNDVIFKKLFGRLKSKIDINRKLDQWLAFIDYSRKELVKMAEEKNNMVREAAEEYEYLTGDAAVQRLAFLKRKWELDYNSGMQYAEEKGIKIGEKRGEIRGEKKKQIEIAKKLKEMGLSIEDIINATKLSKEEIEKL